MTAQRELQLLEPVPQEIRAFLLRAHYHLMDNPRFWYEKGMIDASRILCVQASEFNLEILKGAR